MTKSGKSSNDDSNKPKAKRRLVMDATGDAGHEPTTDHTVTADKLIAVTVSPASKKRRGVESYTPSEKSTSYETPQKRARRPKQVTPGTPLPPAKDESKEEYVPSYIHKNLDYLRKGVAEIDITTRKVFELVKEYYEIPDNFEQSRKYGPLSGTCFEERVISAYSIGLLQSLEEGTPVDICTFCATEGHKRDGCADLI